MAKKTTKAKTKKKVIKQVSNGRAYIQSTFNNTIVTITDQNGDVLGWASAGMVGFKGPKKATPYAAGQVVKKAVDSVKPTGIKEINVFVKRCRRRKRRSDSCIICKRFTNIIY